MTQHLSLEKSDYYKNFPEDTYEALVLDRRRLRNGNEEAYAWRRHDENSGQKKMMRGGGMAKTAKKKMMRGGMAAKKRGKKW